jgi:hypothetical protein
MNWPYTHFGQLVVIILTNVVLLLLLFLKLAAVAGIEPWELLNTELVCKLLEHKDSIPIIS